MPLSSKHADTAVFGLPEAQPGTFGSLDAASCLISDIGLRKAQTSTFSLLGNTAMSGVPVLTPTPTVALGLRKAHTGAFGVRGDNRVASNIIGLPEACLALDLQIAPLPVVIAIRALLGRQYSRRRGLAALDVCELHARLLALPISDELRAELCRWHVEPWFANRGGVKRLVSDEPPARMLDELVVWLLRVLSAQS